MDKLKVIFATPMYNASYHLEELYESLEEQTNEDWLWYIINDMSDDDSGKIASEIVNKDKLGRVRHVKHLPYARRYALKNLVLFLTRLNWKPGFDDIDDFIIAVVDGDDCICNENLVDRLYTEYNKNERLDALWTSHSWDINGMNISRELPGNLNPYQYPWVSSHLKTFRLTTFNKVSQLNYVDLSGEWFKRGYDQALYLPILHEARERMFLDEVSYIYRINSNSLKTRKWKEKDQMDTVRLVRARGYVK